MSENTGQSTKTHLNDSPFAQLVSKWISDATFPRTGEVLTVNDECGSPSVSTFSSGRSTAANELS
jgi:hypothetical protein